MGQDVIVATGWGSGSLSHIVHKSNGIQNPSVLAASLLQTLSCTFCNSSQVQQIALELVALRVVLHTKMASTLMLRSTAPLVGKFQYASSTRRARVCLRSIVSAKGGDSYEV